MDVESVSNSIRFRMMLIVRQFTTITEDELTDLERNPKSALHATLRQRPAQRRLQYDPTKQIDLSSDPRYQLSAEEYIRSIVSSNPCEQKGK